MEDNIMQEKVTENRGVGNLNDGENVAKNENKDEIKEAVKRGPKRKKFIPPLETDDDTQRIVIKEYKTKSSRVLKGGIVRDYESVSHRAIPYVETREYKTACKNVYNECIALIGTAIRDKKKLEAILATLKTELAA